MAELSLEKSPLIEDQKTAILNLLLDRRRHFYESNPLGKWIVKNKGASRLNAEKYRQRSERLLGVLISGDEDETKLSLQTIRDLKFIRKTYPEKEKLVGLARELPAIGPLDLSNRWEAQTAKQLNQLPLAVLLEGLGKDGDTLVIREKIVGFRTNEVVPFLLKAREYLAGEKTDEAKILLTAAERRLGSIPKADDRQAVQRLFWQVKGEYLNKVKPPALAENFQALKFTDLVKRYENLQVVIAQQKAAGDKNKLAALYQKNFRLIAELNQRTNFAFGKLATLKIKPRGGLNEKEWQKDKKFWQETIVSASKAMPRIIDKEAKAFMAVLLAKSLVLFEDSTGQRIIF